MGYSPQTWIDNNASYPLSAARMGVIEQGISDAATIADQGHRILTTAQRDALTGVTAGTMIYNSTAQSVEVYNGTAWSPAGGGLVPIASADLAGVSSYALDNVFSSTYENYRVVFSNYVGPGALYGIARAGGADVTVSTRDAANWAQGPYYSYFGSTGFFNYGVIGPLNWRSTEWMVLPNNFSNYVGVGVHASPVHASFDVFNPYIPTDTAWLGAGHEVTYSMQDYIITSLWNPEFVVHDGFRLFLPSGTVTSGTVNVYGYQEA